MTATSPIPTNVKNTQQLRSMARRRGLKLETTSRDLSNTSAPLARTSRQHDSVSAEHSATSTPVTARNLELEVENPNVPSVDLRKHPHGYIARLKAIPGKISRLWRIMYPEMTPDEIEAARISADELSKDKLCYKEATKVGVMVSRKFAQLGLRQVESTPGEQQPRQKRRMKMVMWDAVARDEGFNIIKMRMNTDPKYLPDYVKVSELGRNPLFTDELLPTIKHHVTFDSDDYGVVMTMYRYGLDGLPESINAEDFWKKLPQSVPSMAVSGGIGNNSKRVWFNLDDCPHLLVCGATKWGKSNFINQLLGYWLYLDRTPRDLQLVLFDLKKGLEFQFYEGLPHLYKDEIIRTGIIETLSDVLPAMKRMQDVRDERMEIIKRAGFKDFNAYNRAQTQASKRLPAIVLVFDEWAKIRLSRGGMDTKAQTSAIVKAANKALETIMENESWKSGTNLLSVLVEFGKEVMKIRNARHFGLEVESMLAEFTNLARAAGMYVILATQNPSKEVLSGLIMVNFSTRIAMRLSVGGSLAALGTQSATRLEVKGRAILMDGGVEQTIQTPFISDSLLRSLVYKATTGKDMKSSGIDLEEILVYALKNMNGELDIARLYEMFRQKKVAKHWITKALRDAEGETFVLEGENYKVMPRGSHSPRHLERVQ